MNRQIKSRRLFLYGVLAVCMLLPATGHAQDRDSALTESLQNKNTIDITFAGSGLVISANYSRKLLTTPAYYLNASIGAGTVPLSGGLTFPHQLSFNLGRRSSFLELGISGTYWTGTSNSSGYTERIYSYQISPLVGYRKHFFNNLIFRAYANPLFHISGEYYLENYKIIPYLGLSIGHSF